MMNQLFKEIQQKMDASFAATEKELGKIHAGRATPAVLDPVVVEAYGTPSKLHQVASINVPDGKHSVMQPWDKTLLSTI